MNLSLEEQLVNNLIEKSWHISCAESCTGGLIASRIVNVANASKVFDASFVTYANEAKMKYLGVSSETTMVIFSTGAIVPSSKSTSSPTESELASTQFPVEGQ